MSNDNNMKADIEFYCWHESPCNIQCKSCFSFQQKNNNKMKTDLELINECCERHGIDPVDLVNYYEHRLHATRDNLPLLFISEGVQLIAEERREQIEKHNRTIEYDVAENDDEQLSLGALMLLSVDYEEGIDSESFPEGWDKNICNKMIGKPYKERLIIAGALIAAEIDRLQNQQK